MVSIRSPPALVFSPTPPKTYTVMNVQMEILEAADIVKNPARIFDANLLYPESMLRMVAEIDQPGAVFWFTLVTLRAADGAAKVEEQFVLQATAAQVKARTNSNRDGGVGLATWVYKILYPVVSTAVSPSPAPQEVTPLKATVLTVVTDRTFEDIAESVQHDCYSQPNGPLGTMSPKSSVRCTNSGSSLRRTRGTTNATVRWCTT